MIMGDEYFGLRDPLTYEIIPGTDKDEWLDWDFALARAFQTVEHYTDQNGIRYWQKEDPHLEIYAERKIDEFQEAQDQITGAKNYKRRNGEYFVPAFKSLRTDKSQWTYVEWQEHEMAEAEKKAAKEAGKSETPK